MLFQTKTATHFQAEGLNLKVLAQHNSSVC